MISPSNVSSQPGGGRASGQVRERKRITRWMKGGYVGVIAGALFIAVEMFLMEASGRAGFGSGVTCLRGRIGGFRVKSGLSIYGRCGSLLSTERWVICADIHSLSFPSFSC